MAERKAAPLRNRQSVEGLPETWLEELERQAKSSYPPHVQLANAEDTQNLLGYLAPEKQFLGR